MQGKQNFISKNINYISQIKNERKTSLSLVESSGRESKCRVKVRPEPVTELNTITHRAMLPTQSSIIRQRSVHEETSLLKAMA